MERIEGPVLLLNGVRLAIGDTVRLRSGGVPMTVFDFVESNDPGGWLVDCIWYHEITGNFYMRGFTPLILDILKQGSAPQCQPPKEPRWNA